MLSRHVKIKDAYPKKVCHMLSRHVKKKEEEKEEKIAHVLKENEKREMVHDKELHPSSTKNIHTLAHLDQGV